eukprot:6682608-Prorocentrum_lima.AAC.1
MRADSSLFAVVRALPHPGVKRVGSNPARRRHSSRDRPGRRPREVRDQVQVPEFSRSVASA